MFLSDAVPTCVAPAGDGSYLVGTLNGVVFRYTGSDMAASDRAPLSEDRVASVGGRTSDGQGGPYATDQLPGLFFPGHGSVVHISASGVVSTVVDNVFAPSGVALSRDGQTLYFTTGSVLTGGGQLMKVSVKAPSEHHRCGAPPMLSGRGPHARNEVDLALTHRCRL